MAKEEDDEEYESQIHETQEEEEEEEVSRSTRRSEKRQKLQVAERNYEEFRRGSILEIILKNFVTYDLVSFSPGAYLNMVIGPNGTGKSSLVCAIALGLGGSPSLLGRQKEIKDFVKRGKDKAVIRVKLKGDGNKTYTIARIFKKSGNQSAWKINGEIATEKKVKALTQSLNIQVDNLCQFLPQDKVCEFAQMNPQFLLHETQRAAGGPELAKQHEDLIRLREVQKTQSADVESEKAHAETLKTRNQGLEREVQRFKEREAILAKIRLIEKAVAGMNFDAGKRVYIEAKRNKDVAKKAHEDKRNEYQPLLKTKQQLRDVINEYGVQDRELRTEQRKAGLSQPEEIVKALEKLEDDLQSKKSQLSGLSRRERENQEKIEKYQLKISQMKRASENIYDECVEAGIIQANHTRLLNSADVDPNSPLGELVSKAHDLKRQNAARRSEIEVLREAREELKHEAHAYFTKKESLQKQLDGLSEYKNRVLDILRQRKPDTYRAYEWIQQNQDSFEKPILGPICIELNVTDNRLFGALENSIGWGNLCNFVVQTKNDYKRFNNVMFDQLKVRIGSVCFEGRRLSNGYKPRYSKGEIKKYGLDGYLIEYVDATEPIMVALCERAGIHSVPLAFGKLDKDRLEASLDHLNRYVSVYDNAQYSINRAYGSKQSRASPLGSATLLAQSVDKDRVGQIENAIAEADLKLEEVKSKLADQNSQFEPLKQREQQLNAEYDEAVNARKEIIAKGKHWQTQQTKIDTQQVQIDSLKEVNFEKERQKLEQQSKEIIVKRFDLVVKLSALQKKSQNLREQRIVVLLKCVKTEAEYKDVSRKIDSHAGDLRAYEEAYKSANVAVEVEKAKLKQLRDIAEKAWSNILPEEEVILQNQYLNRPLEEVEEELNKNKALASINDRADGRVVEEYENRKKEIEELEKAINAKTSILEETILEMERIKGTWLPRLQQLILRIKKNFQESFEKIGCVGDVELDQRENDYKSWGINILVKFREKENLQVLTGSRQSGGERSVSTILYLMSLQELSSSPFRVVDEINQGMDPRNERLIHGLLVKNACEVGKSQYFLITPKLLPALMYHERLTVACIYNGENQPDSFSLREALDQHSVSRSAMVAS